MNKTTAVVMALGLMANVRAEQRAGAAFLKINPSVRGEALGGLNPVSAFGAAGMSVNPAALALMAGHEAATGFASMLGGSSYGTLGLGWKRDGGRGVGVSATFLRSGALEGRDMNGGRTETFSAQDMSVGVTAAWSLGERVRLGAAGKGVRQEIGADASPWAPAADLGAVLETGDLTWGLSALNLGGKLRFQGGTADLPRIYGLGVSVPLGGGLAVLGGVSRVADETTVNLGTEYRLGPVSLRLGYRSDGGSGLAGSAQASGDQFLGGMTGGIGVLVRNMRIDYAVSQRAVEWGLSHRAGLTWKWGARPAEEAPRRPAVQRASKARPAPRSGTSVTTGSRRAYDAALTRKKSKKRWVD